MSNFGRKINSPGSIERSTRACPARRRIASTEIACQKERSGDHRRRTLRPTDRLTTSSAQIFASLGFDLSHFYAIVADFHTRVQYLFSKPRYSVLMSSHLSRSGAVRGNTTADQETRETGDRKASITTCKAAHLSERNPTLSLKSLSGQVKSESKWASKTGGSNSQESRVPE